jgi:hypothetical protein
MYSFISISYSFSHRSSLTANLSPFIRSSSSAVAKDWIIKEQCPITLALD